MLFPEFISYICSPLCAQRQSRKRPAGGAALLVPVEFDEAQTTDAKDWNTPLESRFSPGEFAAGVCVHL